MSDLSELVKKRATRKSAITRIENFIIKSEQSLNVDVHELTVREIHLDKSYESYREIQDEIESIDSTQEQDGIAMEEKYFAIRAKLKRLIERCSTDSMPSTSLNGRQQLSNQTQNTSESQRVNLPQINIPKFNGKYTEWSSFIDLFTALIHNNRQLSDVQKFVYLKSSVSNEPLDIINDLQLTNNNYSTAMDLLKKRYDNKLNIINTHIGGLLEIEQVNKSDAGQLRNFLIHIRQSINALKGMSLPVEHWDLILIYSLCRKLDLQTRKAYELEKNETGQLPNFEEFLEFLEKRCNALENIRTTETKIQKGFHGVSHLSRTNISQAPSNNNKKQNTTCIYCKDNKHNIHRCNKFRNISVSNKRQFVQQNKLCYNCMASGHSAINCSSLSSCRTCQSQGQTRKHHTLLHADKSHNLVNNSTDSSLNQNVEDRDHIKSISCATNNEMPSTVNNSTNNRVMSDNVSLDESAKYTSLFSQGKNNNSQILLATAVVKVVSHSGKLIQARVLLDSGSQHTFITAELFEKLKLVSYKQPMEIGGLGNKLTKINNIVNITIKSRFCRNYELKLRAAVLQNITCYLPQMRIDTKEISIPSSFELADPFYELPSKVDILLGADVYYELLMPGIKNLGAGLPTLLNTKLGWVIAGTAPTQDNLSTGVSLLSCSLGDVNEFIPKFWQLEEIQGTKTLNSDDKKCEEIFCESVKRLKDGSFQVDLPFRTNNAYKRLGDSFNSASQRYFMLEKRFLKNDILFQEYKKFIHEYIRLGHGKIIDMDASNVSEISKRYFLPHHCVVREESITTKLRVVFDASMKSSSGLSLNDVMLKGFTVQPDLFDILCRFRIFKYVITADIEKMYRMIKINPSQRCFQNIIWRDSTDQNLKCIELQTVTYGTNCAPFLATRSLVHLAREEASKFPLAAEALLNQCYVDDILAGSNSKLEAELLVDELSRLLSSGGFRLHKWCSNHSSLLETVDESQRVDSVDISDGSHVNKVLGLKWYPNQDVFKIALPKFNSDTIVSSKRQILSHIAQIFDPLGLVGPVVVIAKQLMQEIWTRRLDWDQTLPDEILLKWKDFIESVLQLGNLTIPRWVRVFDSLEKICINGFCDASLKAYGACVYVTTYDSDGNMFSRLLCSKSRIAPLKTVSLPRLELCGALLLSKLIHKVVSVLPSQVEEVTLWTDSQIVLCWLNSSPSRWTTFVANRVSEIQELTSGFRWLHVRSGDNPADCLSRGLTSSGLISNKLWWNGPTVLMERNSSVTGFGNNAVQGLDEIPEQRKVTHHIRVSSVPFLWSRFSRFIRLQRSVAYCLRFTKNCRVSSERGKGGTVERSTGELSADELSLALKCIVFAVQHECFELEIKSLNQNKLLQESSIKQLNPFIDGEGLLRISGRLDKSDLDFCQKFPLLLPAKHQVVRLLIEYEHKKLFHAGPQAVLYSLRLKYWIIHGIREVKFVLKGCTLCHRFKADSAKQLMGALPSERVSVARPFSRVGIDFGGPVMTKQSKLRGSTVSKGYIALFVCLVTKAVHVELVSSLSTDAFLNTLKRFIARRGKPYIIYSDNATNFKGASHKLNKLYQFFKEKTMIQASFDYLADNTIRWKFIPPSSPHWGGIWEAGIKSVKYHLTRVLGLSLISFEEMTTILAQIEAILNSRPLCPLSSDPSDLLCLTPAHFLIGETMLSYPEEDLLDISENKLSLWQKCEKIRQTFWKRWTKEYLSQLQKRPKWFQESKNLTPGLMVLLKEDNLPPLSWKLGRIIEVMPGSDGKVRVVRVQTMNGQFVRPISKISPLPFENK